MFTSRCSNGWNFYLGWSFPLRRVARWVVCESVWNLWFWVCSDRDYGELWQSKIDYLRMVLCFGLACVMKSSLWTALISDPFWVLFVEKELWILFGFDHWCCVTLALMSLGVMLFSCRLTQHVLKCLSHCSIPSYFAACCNYSCNIHFCSWSWLFSSGSIRQISVLFCEVCVCYRCRILHVML